MPTPIEEDASYLLVVMAESGQVEFHSDWLERRSGLDPVAVGRALDYLDDLGAIKLSRSGERYAPRGIRLQSRGLFLYQAMRAQEHAAPYGGESGWLLPEPPPNPVATPYGLTPEDWATVALRKADSQTLHVAFALPFVSPHYDMKALVRNVEDRFRRTVQEYNCRHASAMITVRFEHLLAGLNRHAFNRVARDVIGADLAVFETSDANPTVMLAMGVALTWGITVVPLRRALAHAPVLDVSGQGYVMYDDSAAQILYESFDEELMGAIEQAIRSKTGRERPPPPFPRAPLGRNFQLG